MAIPQDIIDTVIAAVGDDKGVLKQCALVSSSFLLPSRKQIFSEIWLTNDQASQRLHQVLDQNPVILPFVKSITIGGTVMLNPSVSLLAVLQLPFRHLEIFSLRPWTGRKSSWKSDFTKELKDVLSNIIHSSTLKTLHLGCLNVPITLFLGIAHLVKLELVSVCLDALPNEQPSSLIPTGVSEGVPTTSHTKIDQCVWRFVEDDLPTEPISLPFMSRLRFFEINTFLDSRANVGVLSPLLQSLHASLTSPATLEHLEFNIKIIFNSQYLIDEFYEGLRGADLWGHLDSIITLPVGSHLQRVDINIAYYIFGEAVGPSGDEKICRAILEELPSLSDKGILFVQKVGT